MFLRSIVEWIVSLESGESFRKMSSLWLRICAVLTLVLSLLLALGLLIGGPMLIGEYIGTVANTFFTIGFVLCDVMIVSMGIVLFMLLRNRANKIDNLGEESHLIFGPIASVYIRLAGEIWFLMFSGLASVLLILAIFSIVGLQWLPMLICFLLSIFFLLLGYFLLKFLYIIAEYAGVIADIATNTKRIETIVANAVSDTTS